MSVKFSIKVLLTIKHNERRTTALKLFACCFVVIEYKSCQASAFTLLHKLDSNG
jgi:hypothetical protein